MFGLNQDECCNGETAETCPAPTATVAGRPLSPAPPTNLQHRRSVY